MPKRVAIIHCPSHQKGTMPVARGNNLADKAAKVVALKEMAASVLAMILPEPPNPSLPECPVYTEEEIKWAKNQPMSWCSEGWWQMAEGKLNYPLPWQKLHSGKSIESHGSETETDGQHNETI